MSEKPDEKKDIRPLTDDERRKVDEVTIYESIRGRITIQRNRKRLG